MRRERTIDVTTITANMSENMCDVLVAISRGIISSKAGSHTIYALTSRHLIERDANSDGFPFRLTERGEKVARHLLGFDAHSSAYLSRMSALRVLLDRRRIPSVLIEARSKACLDVFTSAGVVTVTTSRSHFGYVVSTSDRTIGIFDSAEGVMEVLS